MYFRSALAGLFSYPNGRGFEDHRVVFVLADPVGGMGREEAVGTSGTPDRGGTTTEGREMNKNDELEQLTAAAIGQWGMTRDDAERIAHDVIENIKVQYRIEPKGTPIKPDDVRKGDHIRAEWDDGDVTESTASGPFADLDQCNLFLLDRPDPDANFVFPTGDGAVIRLESKHDSEDHTVASREHGNWFVAGETSVYTEDGLRQDFYNFEVLSDGDDQ